VETFPAEAFAFVPLAGLGTFELEDLCHGITQGEEVISTQEPPSQDEGGGAVGSSISLLFSLVMKR
jgi:hypothetical protein